MAVGVFLIAFQQQWSSVAQRQKTYQTLTDRLVDRSIVFAFSSDLLTIGRIKSNTLNIFKSEVFPFYFFTRKKMKS